MSISFQHGMPFAPEGFGVRRNFYQSGRISAKVADIAGVFELNYVGRQPFRNQRFYASNEQCTFGRCMVVQVLIDGSPYRLPFENTTHYPFGYRSECTLEDVRLRHELVLDRNALFRRVTVLANPSGKEVRCRLVQMNAGMGQGAKWRIAARPEGSPRLVAEARFHGGATVAMEIGSASPVTFPDNSLVDPRAFPGNPDHVQDFRFDMEERRCAALPHLFWWVFDPAPDEDLSSARVDRVFADFRARRADDARFETGDAYADGHLGFVPATSAAFEVDGIGAFRASPTYWVWGWDALVHSGTLALCGRAAEVRRMLAFFRDNAGPGGAIEHAYATDFSFQKENLSMPGETCFQPVNASFWLILLDEYVNATGDTAFKAECMDFARSLVERNRREVAPFLLPRGQGWIPDNRYPLGQEKDDFCLSNCSVYWQGLCAWRDLSGEDEGVEAAARDIVAKFWDAEAGYWADSWDAKAGKPRPFRPLHGFYHVSRFARELFAYAAAGGSGGAAPRPAPIAAYMERHFLLGDRLAMYDRENLAIRRADGNQFGAYYPVQDRTFWNAMNGAGRTDALARFRRIVASHGRVLTYPEGQTVDVLNADPSDYSDELGNKQFFAAKGWLADALDLWLGLGVSKAGIAFHPMNDGVPFAVRGLTVRGRTLDVEMSGAGAAEAARYTLNGSPLAAPFVPWSALSDGRNTLSVSFAGAPSAPEKHHGARRRINAFFIRGDRIRKEEGDMSKSERGFNEFNAMDMKPTLRFENADAARGAWFDEARYGVFIHYGAYSVAARGEWVRNRERLSEEEYSERYAKNFKAERLDCADWARKFKQWGFGYAVLTARHHDGYAMWDSKVNPFNCVKVGGAPDVVGQYVEAMRAGGLKVGLYYSPANWSHPDYPGPFFRDWPGTGDWKSEEARRRFVAYYRAELAELLGSYGPIDYLWFDGCIPENIDGDETMAWLRRDYPAMLVNNRLGKGYDVKVCEQCVNPPKDPAQRWESCMTLNGNWGWHAGDAMWKRPAEVIDLLGRCAASGGNLLLNVGPKADGTIPDESERILGEVGEWLAANRRAFSLSERHPFSWNNTAAPVTARGSSVFLTFLRNPGGSFRWAELANRCLAAKWVDDGSPVEFEQRDGILLLKGLSWRAPGRVVELSVEGRPETLCPQTTFWIPE